MVDPPQALSALTARDSRKAGWERKLTAPQNGWLAAVQAALSKPREAADVGYWPKADLAVRDSDVRFQGVERTSG